MHFPLAYLYQETEKADSLCFYGEDNKLSLKAQTMGTGVHV